MDKSTNYKSKSLMSFSKIILVILIGESGVGKSCLFNVYKEGMFPTHMAPTIGYEFQAKKLNMKDGT